MFVCALKHVCVHADARLCRPTACAPLQPAVRDFNEEDYMDGDLMDEELVE